MSEHTPGPWGSNEHLEGGAVFTLKRRHWEVGSHATGEGVALVFGDNDANARLIASAPQLEADLKEAVEIIKLLAPQCDYMAQGIARAFLARMEKP